jgi:hypothetical protein
MVQQRQQLRALANQFYENNYTEIVFVEPKASSDDAAS